jgi:hypothetical protein
MPDPYRVVEVFGASEGSGYLISQRLVLTARHVVCPKAGQPGQPTQVRVLRDYLNATPKDRVTAPRARQIWPPEGCSDDTSDFALLVIDSPASPNDRPIYWGELPVWGETSVDALGFPDSALFTNQYLQQAGRGPFRERDTRPVSGLVTPGSGLKAREAYGAGGFDIVLRAEDQPSGSADAWKGMSGAAVFEGPNLVGVVQKANETRALYRLKASPVAQLFGRDDVTRAIRTAGLTVPPQRRRSEDYDILGTEAFSASCRTFQALASKPFYGRTKDLEVLDRSLDEHDRGVILLRGEAGLGKSRLTVQWADRCANTPDTTVLRHAFSVREPVAGDRAAMVKSLLRQGAASLGPEALGGDKPGDAALWGDRLAVLLQTDQPDHFRLVVVLDALDEAAEPIAPWVTHLGRGVFVLVTCRAEAGEEPRILKEWHERAANNGLPAVEHVLHPLDDTAIAEWLSAATKGALVRTDSLVSAAMRASEGVPLFAAYLIPDAIDAMRASAADPFPATFNDYARRQLNELRDRLTGAGRWSWGKVLDLFAVLFVAREPLPSAAIRSLIGGESLDDLDLRAERWLWRRSKSAAMPAGDGPANRPAQPTTPLMAVVSFAHPRLATVFGAVLPEFDTDVVAIEQLLVTACEKAWRTSHDLLKAYALAWLPAHLIKLKRIEEAADLLGNAAFLVARLETSPSTAMIHRVASETINLDLQVAGRHPAIAAWRRFWAETETRLVMGAERAESLGLATVELLAQLVEDRFEPRELTSLRLLEVLPRRPAGRPRLAHACGFRHPALMRSLDEAHKARVWGVLALDDGLVSWGEDGAIRFWSRAGAPRAGGDPFAHEGGVLGVVALDDGLVSWGYDGAIRFWSRAGEPRAGGAPAAHKGGVSGGGVLGVLALDDGLVSWGYDGAIRFWSRAGEPRAGGDPAAHKGGVSGVLALDDGLVSWGRDGAIRFWSRAGSCLGPAWIAPTAHVEFVRLVREDLWIGLQGRPHQLLLASALGQPLKPAGNGSKRPSN